MCHRSILNIRSSKLPSLTDVCLTLFPATISTSLLNMISSSILFAEPGLEKSLLARENGSCLLHRSNSSLMGVEGLDASLKLWMGTFTGREVASRKLVRRVLLTISEWMGRKSGLDEDRDDFFDDVVDAEELNGRNKYSNIVTDVTPAKAE